MKILFLICLVLCVQAHAEVDAATSNVVSAAVLWGRDAEGFRASLWNTSFSGELTTDARLALKNWYQQILEAQIPTNYEENVIWTDIKADALQMFSHAPGIVDSTNVWFAVADARAGLQRRIRELDCVTNSSEQVAGVDTNGVAFVTIGYPVSEDRVGRVMEMNARGTARGLLGSMDACLEDFLRDPYFSSLPEAEQASIRSNLLHRAGISTSEAEDLGL